MNRSNESIPVLDKGYVKFIDKMGSDERIIEAARQSTSGSFVSWGPYEGHARGDVGLLEFLYSHDHSSPFEMGELVVEVYAPIMVARQWMRHRTFSYNEASARYTVLPEDYYVPPDVRLVKQAKHNKQASSDVMLDENVRDRIQIMIAEEQSMFGCDYRDMVEHGLSREVARINMPVSTYTRFWCKGNLRNWLHFMKQRLKPNAQWEIRQYAEAVSMIIADAWPRTWKLFLDWDLNGMRLNEQQAHEFSVYMQEREEFMKWKAVRGVWGGDESR